MVVFLLLTAATSACSASSSASGRKASKAAGGPAARHHAAELFGRQLLLDRCVAAALAEDRAVQPDRLSDQRLRWSFFEIADVHVGVSLAMTLLFLAICLAVVWWMFKTGYRLKK